MVRMMSEPTPRELYRLDDQVAQERRDRSQIFSDIKEEIEIRRR